MPAWRESHFQSLLDLVPGTTEASFQHSQFFNASSSLQTQVNGAMRMGNNTRSKASTITSERGCWQVLIPPSEAIVTVDVSTTNYNAGARPSIGAVVNVQLKFQAGTGITRRVRADSEHRTGRPRVLQSFRWDPWSTTARAEFGRGPFAATICSSSSIICGPWITKQYEPGDHSILGVPPRRPQRRHGASDLRSHYRQPGRTGRMPISGNMIPAEQINSIAAKILSFLAGPQPSPLTRAAPSNNYFRLLPSQKTTDALDSKIDWTASARDTISARFSFSHPVIFQAPIFGDAGGPAQGAFPGPGSQRKRIAPELTTTEPCRRPSCRKFRVGVSHYHNEATQSRLVKVRIDVHVGMPRSLENPACHSRTGSLRCDSARRPRGIPTGRSATGFGCS